MCRNEKSLRRVLALLVILAALLPAHNVSGQSAALYSTATVNNSRTVTFPVASRTAPFGSIDAVRYNSFSRNETARLQQSIEFLPTPLAPGFSGTMNVSVYVKYHIPVLHNVSSPATLMVFVATPTSQLASNPVPSSFTSVFGSSKKPSLARSLLFSCTLPSLEELGLANQCPTSAFLCGVGSIPIPLASRTSTLTAGAAHVLVASIATSVLYPKTTTQDTDCINSVEVTAIWDPVSAAQVTFRTAVQYSSNTTEVPADLLMPTRFAASDASALANAVRLFAPHSDPRGRLWTPLLLDDAQWDRYPFGSVLSRFTLSNYTTASTALLTAMGVVCHIDDSLLKSSQPNGNWISSCVMPTKGATYGSLSFRIPDALNATRWLKGIRITLSSTQNTSIPTRLIVCNPVAHNAYSSPSSRCRSYVDCVGRPLYLGAGDGSGQLYTQISIAWSPAATGYIPAIVSDNLLEDSSTCLGSITAALVYTTSSTMLAVGFPAASCNALYATSCPVDNVCVSIQQVCDGFADCSDGADERGCDGWTTLHTTMSFSLCPNVIDPAAVSYLNTYQMCLKYAQAHSDVIGGLLFTVSTDDMGSCQFFRVSCVDSLNASSILANLSSMDASLETSMLVLNLAQDVRNDLASGIYGCNDFVACSGRGTARPLPVAGLASGCICTCSAGFSGADCSRTNPLMNGNVMQLLLNGASTTVSAALLSTIQSLVPAVGRMWVHTVFFDAALSKTKVVVSADRGALLDDPATITLLQTSILTLSTVEKGVAQPLQYDANPSHCVFDDLTRSATCTYFRRNTSHAVDLVLSTLQPLFASTVDYDGFAADGSLLVSGACGIVDVLSTQDLSYEFIVEQNGGALVDSWCPASTTCLIPSVPGSVVAVQLQLQLPPGFNSTTLSLPCANVPHFQSATVLPTLLELTSTPTNGSGTPSDLYVVTMESNLSALLSFVVFLGLAVLCLVLVCLCRRADDHLIELAKQSAEYRIGMKHAALSVGEKLTQTYEWAIRVQHRATRGNELPSHRQPRRHIAMWLSLGSLFVGVACICITYYRLADPSKSTNYQLVLMVFDDSQCERAGSGAPKPSAVYEVSASGECQPRVAVGKSQRYFPRYLSATCHEGASAGTFSSVDIRYGDGEKVLCNEGSLQAPIGACIAAPAFPEGPQQYLIALCLDPAAEAAVVSPLRRAMPVALYATAAHADLPMTQAAADGLTSSSASADSTIVGQQIPPYSSGNPYSTTDTVTGNSLSVFYYYDTADRQLHFSTSGNGLYMLSYSVGDSSSLVGPANVPKELLVSQTTKDFLSTTVVSDIRAYEEGIADSDRFLPRSAQTDVPIGRFFNGYGAYSSNRTQLGTADISLQDYLYFPGIMGQNIDIGNTEASIAFWLRAGPTSRGFPVASIDYWRLKSNGASPLLQRLERMILSGNMDATEWFTNGWNVYWAVYLDGVEQKIYFVSAGPLEHQYTGYQDTSVFSIMWDLGELNLLRIFTNRWHHIGITLELPINEDQSGSQKSGLDIRLTVDGQSYSGNQGFLRCLPRQVESVYALWTPEVSVPQDSAVVQGAAVVVGAINAGLHGVLVDSSAWAPSDYISVGTVPMNNFFNVNSAEFFALGFYVLFIGVSMFCMMIVGVVMETMSDSKKRALREMLAVEGAYQQIIGTSIHAEKFRISGKDYALLPVGVAKEVLALDNSIFATLMTELQRLAPSSEAAKADLLAIIWMRGQANYKPSTPQLVAIQQNFKTSERADLSRDGYFYIPTALWSDFVEHLVEYWGSRVEKQWFDDDTVRLAAQPGKLQVKVQKVKVGKVGGSKGGKQGKSSTSVRKLTNNIKLNTTAPIQMLMPVVLAMQAAVSYLRNFQLPIAFQSIVSGIFFVVSLQWFHIPSVPDLFFAALQFLIGIGITLLVLYFCVSDHDDWLAFVGAYAAKRDQLDKAKIAQAGEPAKPKSQRKQLLVSLGEDGDLDDEDLFSDKYKGLISSGDLRHPSVVGLGKSTGDDGNNNDDDDDDDDVRTQPLAPPRINWFHSMIRNVLPITISIPMDEFIDKSRRSNLIPVRRRDLVPASVAKRNMTWEMEYHSDRGIYMAHDADDRSVEPLPMMDVGVLCPLHRAVLCELDQRDTCIAPYQCFASLLGNRCSTTEGAMFCCRSRLPDGRFCPYSLCQTHVRTSVMDLIKIAAKSGLMEMFGEGAASFVAFLAISLTSVIYFPVVQVCMQFLVCDPQYQCLFPTCWADADTAFLLAACVVILMLLVVGVGMPLALYWELNRRKKVLFALFHRKEYNKLYLAVDEDAMEEREEQRARERASVFATDQQDATETAGVFGFLAKFFCRSITGETVDEDTAQRVDTLRKNTVDFGEWERFLAGDNSALQLLYRFLEYEWLTLPPFLMLYRIAVLIPTVFVTDNQFIQMTLLACVEIGFGTFIFWTEPYINPWIDTMYRAGSVHNILQIGLAAININLNAENSALDLSNLMLIVTGVYFLLVVGIIAMTTIWPTLSVALDQVRVAGQMKAIGMRTIDMSSLFLNPLMHARQFCNIVDVYSKYEEFVRTHPELKPGDDLNVVHAQLDSALSRGTDNTQPQVEMRTRSPRKGDAPDAFDAGEKSGNKGSTVGEGVLGPLAGVPSHRRTREEEEEDAAHVSHAPKTFLESMVEVVGGKDLEDELRDDEMD